MKERVPATWHSVINNERHIIPVCQALPDREARGTCMRTKSSSISGSVESSGLALQWERFEDLVVAATGRANATDQFDRVEVHVAGQVEEGEVW